jgi:hypothetical protein
MRGIQRIMTLAVATAAAASMGGIGVAHAADNTAADTNKIVASGNYTGVLLNGLTVAFECHAAAPGAVSTEINACYLTSGPSAGPIALPGDAAATASVGTVPFVAFRLCWTASATYVNAGHKSTSGCTLLPSVGGVPSLAGTGVSTA